MKGSPFISLLFHRILSTQFKASDSYFQKKKEVIRMNKRRKTQIAKLANPHGSPFTISGWVHKTCLQCEIALHYVAFVLQSLFLLDFFVDKHIMFVMLSKLSEVPS